MPSQRRALCPPSAQRFLNVRSLFGPRDSVGPDAPEEEARGFFKGMAGHSMQAVMVAAEGLLKKYEDAGEL